MAIPLDAGSRAPGRRCPSTILALALLLLVACRPSEPAPTGQALFRQHCASCHGESGDGAGPVAASLDPAPSDLRRIAARNGGRFDEAAVMSVIDGRRAVAAHGPREMPVWGAVFQEQNSGESYPAYTSLLHSRALTEYLQSIQQ